MQNCFTIRVYAIIINTHQQVLVSHEEIEGFAFTKFPGGGLEFGEGTKEALTREVLEETGVEVRVRQHLYTTDFFIANHFNPQEQVFSIYYLAEAVNTCDLQNIPTNAKLHRFRHTNNKIWFEWKAPETLQPHFFTFETEKEALKKLHHFFRL